MLAGVDSVLNTPCIGSLNVRCTQEPLLEVLVTVDCHPVLVIDTPSEDLEGGVALEFVGESTLVRAISSWPAPRASRVASWTYPGDMM